MNLPHHGLNAGEDLLVRGLDLFLVQEEAVGAVEVPGDLQHEGEGDGLGGVGPVQAAACSHATF